MQALVLALVGIGITVAVYGVVALIVKADDFGVALAKNEQGSPLAYGPGTGTCPRSRYAHLPDFSHRRRHGRHDLGWGRYRFTWPGCIWPTFNRLGG